MGILMRTKEFLVKLKIINLQPNSLYGAARFANFEGILGFSVPSNICINPALAFIPSLSRLLKNSEGNRDGE